MTRSEGFSKKSWLALILIGLCSLIVFIYWEMESTQAIRQGDAQSKQSQTSHSAGSRLRIVSLSPATTEWLFLLGYGDRLVGRTEACNWPIEVKQVASMGGFLEPHLGSIIQTEPNLVLVTSDFNPRRVAELRRSGLEVFVLDTRDVTDLISSVKELEARLNRLSAQGRPGADESALSHVIAKWEGLRSVFPNRAPSYVGFVHAASQHVFSETSFLGAVLSRLGLMNIVQTKQGFPQIADDFLRSNRPDFVVVFHPGSLPYAESESLYQKFGFDRFWTDRSVTVLSLPEDLFLRPGPRLFEEGLDLVTGLLTEAHSL